MLLRCIKGGLLCLVLVLAGEVVAENTKSPDFIDGSKLVNADELIELVNKKPDFVMIDSRIRSDRRQGYIEGSKSLPNIETDCDALRSLLKTKQTPVLFYCNGVKCGRSAKAVITALGCGYAEVYWFRGGFEEWRSKGYPYLTAH